MTGTESMTIAIHRLEQRKTKALTDSISATARNQLLTASEMLAKHLRNAPAGTTVRDLITAKERTLPKPETYLSDTDYNALLDALTSLDRDPAHPQPLRDRITEVLGEIGNVWPASTHPDAVDQIAVTPADKSAAKRYRDILDQNDKAMVKLNMTKASEPHA